MYKIIGKFGGKQNHDLFLFKVKGIGFHENNNKTRRY